MADTVIQLPTDGSGKQVAAKSWTQGTDGTVYSQAVHIVSIDGDGTSPDSISTASVTNVASSATAVTLLAALATRKGVIVYNDSTSAARIKYGTGASATSFTVYVPAGALWEMPKPIYRGAMTIIWDSANGNARVTEL